MFRRMNPFFSSYGPHYIDPDRARALAAHQAKRAQWLPDEAHDGHAYNYLRPNAYQNQAAIEEERRRRQQEGLRRGAEEEQGWEQQLDRHQKEVRETRRKLQEERDGEIDIEAERERDRSQSPRRPRGPQPPPTSAGQKPPSTHDQQETPNSPPHRPIPTPPSPVPKYDQKHIDAASKLQHHFRIRKSFRAIHSLSSQFHTLRRDFTNPPILSFQSPSSPPNSGDVINVAVVSPSTESEEVLADVDSSNLSIPKLAFNSTNYLLHSYLESLDKLLIKLDGIDSWGDQDVRVRRRAAIKEIEGEQARLDMMLKDSWIKYTQIEAEK